MATESGGYRPLNEQLLREWLASQPRTSGCLGGAPSDWTIQEVGDGNLNYVFIVRGPAGSLVAKQALPYVRVVGEGWPLSYRRAHFENLALQEQAVHVPHLVPSVYHYDPELALIAMEHLTPHIVLRKGLVQGLTFPSMAEDIAEFLAKTLFHTSALGGPAAAHKQRMADFAGNHEICRVTEDLVFTDPYWASPLNRWTSPELDDAVLSLRRDTALKAAAQERKHQFITSAQALIHGDLHTGSIMVTPENTKVIDPEFAFVGPMGFDVGAIVANLLLAYLARTCAPADAEAREYSDWILKQVVDVWSGFEERFLTLWEAGDASDVWPAKLFVEPHEAHVLRVQRQAFMDGIFTDSLAFAGCKMIRRIVGLAHVEDLESIEDPSLRAIGETRALHLGAELLKDPRNFRSIGAVVAAARDMASDH